ncbi:Asp-tRNA(Asn)/Glu-tRNA(Gln) amidotransferase subunit GatC [Thermodesulfobacterium sp. TA1]|uniref:Asp-tRNA(Asn)/Glu-tRNA(Gln) amidotransferase subunit GatC n=1 Tax=Thermodesulfobacterium sp. TA1 TaxID=2234087 RepID=UPI001231865A|nr:Asp-tRNA(Asn)/Glu-tRNA(Gln) amidotransferase subunit GatC [Thermodesulfobacterium sp. TA1]QER41836.1 Asp-tRNA(Asn)/Glu-tRNA(Gln) amidotransferase subunit GatC [Thermodesulfobacterium sp. TA1]
MPISLEEVLKIAHLCRLEFEEEEAKKFSEELSKILDYFKTLQTLDTKDVPPTFHAIKLPTPYREDKVKPFENIEGLLANAPKTKDNMIVVSKVVKAPS